MRFDVGLWDRLFGKKTTLELPGPGGNRRVQVTVRWLQRMQAAGKISEEASDQVIVHILDPGGAARALLVGHDSAIANYRTEVWTVGEQVKSDTVDRLLDAESRSLYVLIVYEQGEPKTLVVKRELWDQAKRSMDAV